mgnify:FL=1
MTKTFLKNPGPAYLPGDPAPSVEAIIRVDHAGEFGAVRIYEGQLAVLPPGPARDAVAEMAAQEQEHLETFNKLIVSRGVRPTALSPLWNLAGYALGAVTARLGPRAAMACTVAVEEVIDKHYREQAEKLGENEAPLKEIIEKFRAEELEHRDTALEHDAEQALGYPVLSALVKAGSLAAIWLSTRI